MYVYLSVLKFLKTTQIPTGMKLCMNIELVNIVILMVYTDFDQKLSFSILVSFFLIDIYIFWYIFSARFLSLLSVSDLIP